MKTIRIIPCLDVADGNVVKGVRFKELRTVGTPSELAQRYEHEGADEVVFLDISASLEGRATADAWVRDVRSELSIPLTVGGGVNSVGSAERLLLAGADKVAINTAAVARPQLISELAQTFGRQCVVLSIDAKRFTERDGSLSWRVITHSGEQEQALLVMEWAKTGVSLGAGEVLLTSYDRDGTGCGYDVGLIRQIATEIDVPLVASGGASELEHFYDAVEAGASAVLAASVFHDKKIEIADLKAFLRAKGQTVRLDFDDVAPR